MTHDEFSRLALSHLDEVAAYARRLCRSPWDADDLVQAAYEHAFRKWVDLAEPARCRAWLFRIARNLHIDHTRTATARPELRLVAPSDALGPEPLVAAETVERLTAMDLEGALLELRSDEREAVLLCDLWGFRYEEIANIIAAPIGTVRSRISRARSQLARALVRRQRSGTSGGTR